MRGINSLLDRDSEQLLGRRDQQQDYLALVTLGGGRSGDLLAVVADGMGGHVGGAQASEAAVSGFVECYQARRPADVASQVAMDSGVAPGDALDRALRRANQRIAGVVADRPQLRGMGTTLVAVLFRRGRVYWVSVGDSLLYRLRDGRLERLNADHSLAAELDRRAARGEISHARAINDRSRQLLTSCLTGAPIPLVDLQDRGLFCRPGDRFLIASDGIATLAERRIAELLGQSVDASGAVRALIRAVTASGHPFQDNCTVVAVFIPYAASGTSPSTGLARSASGLPSAA